MGRKNKLPPSSGGTQAKRKQDTGLPAFFKHRREQEQRKLATASVVAPAMTTQQQSVKGKERDTETAQSLAASVEKTMQADAATSAEGDSSWSQYDHLNGNFQGGNKDSSLRAYARHLRSLISQSDVLIQILDARDPMGSRFLSTEALISAHPGKRLLFVLTKIDLVPKAVLQGWLEKLRETHATLAFKSTATLSGTGRASRKLHTHTEASASSAASSSLEGSTAATLLQLLKNYARSQPKGMSLTVGIFGQPNVGKSSLINSLVRSRACSVAPRPGETKTLQTVLLDRKVRLVDSPGVAMGGGGGASEDTTKDVLRGTVKLELVEDPITPVGEILRRADPIKVTKLYRLPPIEGDGEAEEAGGYAGVDAVAEPEAMVPDLEARSPQPQHQVDFKSLRAGREEMDESDDEAEDEDDDDGSFIFNHSDHGDEDDSLLDSTTPQHSTRTRGAIGYDRHDPMDFLLRLALTRGKMLRGGKPDVEGAARGVINDWNTGKIAWCVAPPARGKREKMKAAERVEGVERDDEMKPAPAATAATAKTADAPTDEPTVVSGFSDAFDLEGLFAQADAQIFGGNATTSKGNAAPAPAPPAAPPINKTVLHAADVSASSLGKRGRGGVAAGDESEGDEDAQLDEGDSDSEDEDDAQPKRMQLQPPSSVVAQGEEDDEMTPRGARPQPQQQRPAPSTEDKELSSFLEGAAKDAVRTASSHQQQYQRPTGGFTPSGKPKRGQRNQHKKGVSNDEPEYLSRLAHKATLPTNVKKSVGKRDQYIEQEEEEMMGGGGGRAKKGKRGDERRKKRKMARREETRDGGVGVGVVSGLEGVRLGDE